MNNSRIVIVAVSVVGILFATLHWICSDDRNPDLKPGSQDKVIKVERPDTLSHSAQEQTLKSQESETERRLLQRRTDKRWKKLQFLDPESLKVSNEVIDYLELTPEQVAQVNRGLDVFTKDLFQNELSRAFVEITANGNEEIVVPAFDRRPIHTALKLEIAQWAGPDFASSIAELISHDAQLGAVNTELRLGIQKGSDGRDRLVYTRKVLDPEAYDPDIPINRYYKDGPRPDVPTVFSSTAKIRTEGILTDTLKPRLKFLFDAVETLPRQSK